jgi:hypothetical protein
MPEWISKYLTTVRQMVEEADASTDPRVKIAAVRILERQAITIRELEFDHWADSLVSRRCEL